MTITLLLIKGKSSKVVLTGGEARFKIKIKSLAYFVIVLTGKLRPGFLSDVIPL